MDRSEKSSRKSRDSDRDRGRDPDSTKDYRDSNESHKHRSSKDKSRGADDGHHHRSKHRDGEDRRRSRDEKNDHNRRSAREYSMDRERERSRERPDDRHKREKSHDRDGEGSRDGAYDREKREKSFDREVKRERSFDEDEELVDKRSRLHKRKERGESEDRLDDDDKQARLLEDMKKRRRFEDRAQDGKEENGTEMEEKRDRRRFEDGVKDKEVKNKEERRERRKFEDKVKKEERENGEERRQEGLDGKNLKKEVKNEPFDSYQSASASSRGGSAANGAVFEPPNIGSRSLLEISLATGHPSPTKVSSISTPNENKGVNINRSHEVPGKSSTDGTTSDAGKSGGLSLDALAKAKRALQMRKELAEKLKKIPLFNKRTGSETDGGSQLGSKEGHKVPFSSPGILPTPAPSGTVTSTTVGGATTLSAAATSMNSTGGDLPQLSGLTEQKYEAVKRAQELAVKMGFRQDPEFAPLINMFPGQMPPEVTIQPKPAKVPVLRLDALGREIDEHGNVVNMPKLNNLSTLKVNINKQKKDAFQILKPELDVDPEENPHFDARMGVDKNKLLRPKRMTFQFVEEGKWSKDAEIIKLKSQFGEAQAKELKVKQAQLARAKAEPDINPNLIEVSERVIPKEKPKDLIPEIEWWDAPLLHSGAYGDVTDGSIAEDKLKTEKITIYVEHPRPIDPPSEPTPPPPQPLKLTKREQKKLRTQRRLAREKDRQEMIRQGLIEPPKPKVKMSNLMKVLGSEATQDPTKLEMEIRSAAAEREQAHVDRNIARKLTPAERREKKERKLFDDPNNTQATLVSVFKINDLSHPQTRFKVDVNAQENRLTGCAVIADGISVVVVEGGSKSIKRYGKLMLRRINWAAAVKIEEDDEDESVERPVNKCLLVWQGTVAKPSFHRFFVHECRTEAAARKVLSDAGVGHYWDLAVNFTEDQM